MLSDTERMARMRRFPWLTVVVMLSAVALLVIGLPHAHAQSQTPNLNQSCQLCQFQHRGSATPTASSVHLGIPSVEVATVVLYADAPRATGVPSAGSPRAPPRRS